MKDLIKKIEKLLEEKENVKRSIKNFEIDPENYVSDFESYFNSLNPQAISINGQEYNHIQVVKILDIQSYEDQLQEFCDEVDKRDDSDYIELVSELSDIDSELEENTIKMLNAVKTIMEK